jgi:hypothetical protein
MNKIYNLKILIVGLTTVLALTSLSKSDFKKNCKSSKLNCKIKI